MPLLHQRAARGPVRSPYRRRDTLLSRQPSFFPSLLCSGDQNEPISSPALLLLEIIDAVGVVRDSLHLQDCVYLAQEYGLLAQHYVFGCDYPDLTGGVTSRPYSRLLDTHYHELLRQGLVEPRHDSGLLRTVRSAWPNDTHHDDVSNRDAFVALGRLTSGDMSLLVRTTVWLAQQGKHIHTPAIMADLPAALAFTARRMCMESEDASAIQPLAYSQDHGSTPSANNHSASTHSANTHSAYTHICSVCAAILPGSPRYPALIG